MARPLMATKFHVPLLRPGAVVRPRLLDRLRQGSAARLTLLSAPAGFGKTTLLADWLAERADESCVAWLSLDVSDGDPDTFLTYVIGALQTAIPSVGGAALELLASSPVPAERVLTAVLNELAGQPESVRLILDDYHLVDNAAIAASMVFLLQHIPATVQVVISTRADPDLPLSRLRARGELVEIRAADLRFTTGEAADYLDLAAGRRLTATDVAVLSERTEGWIAALQLAALSIQSQDDVSGFITGFAGDHRYIVDYLVDEVLRHQSETTRDFLLHTAFLDRLSGPLCDAVTGRTDGAGMLGALERANLFIVTLDDRREWYRYHHLFADVLRARLLSEQPDRIGSLHSRASSWYEQHDLTTEAVRHAVAANDVDRAVRLIELAVPLIRRHRQESIIHGWLKALPDEAVRHSPVLSVFYGSMLMVGGRLDDVEPRLVDAERALASVSAGEAIPWADTAELHTLPATIAIYRASIAQARGDVMGTAHHARRALELAGPDDHLARGGAAGFLGLAAWADGSIKAAVDTFGQAVASLHAAGNLVDELTSTGVLADMWLAAGRPLTARTLYHRALRVAEETGEPVARAAAELHVGLSEIDLETDDLVGADRHLDRAAALGDRTGFTESSFRWFVARARLAQASGDSDQAVELLGRAEDLYRPGFSPRFDRSQRCGPGSGSPRETCRWPPAGPPTAASTPLTHRTIYRSLTTSAWSGS